jgi:hypothetical protein
MRTSSPSLWTIEATPVTFEVQLANWGYSFASVRVLSHLPHPSCGIGGALSLHRSIPSPFFRRNSHMTLDRVCHPADRLVCLLHLSG